MADSREPLPYSLRDVAGLRESDADLLANGEVTYLPTPVMSTPFGRLLADRRSVRPSMPCRLEDVASVLAHVMLPTVSWTAADGYLERQSPVPSAGGRHPLSILILASELIDHAPGAWMVSPDDSPALVPIALPDDVITSLFSAASAALRNATPAPVLAVALARRRRTLSKYPWGESLLWRDAGALLATMHLVAFDSGLISSLVGIADTVAISVPGSEEHLFDVGAIAIGGPAT